MGFLNFRILSYYFGEVSLSPDYSFFMASGRSSFKRFLPICKLSDNLLDIFKIKSEKKFDGIVDEMKNFQNYEQ